MWGNLDDVWHSQAGIFKVMSLSPKPLRQLTNRNVSRSASCVEIWGLFGSLSTECDIIHMNSNHMVDIYSLWDWHWRDGMDLN